MSDMPEEFFAHIAESMTSLVENPASFFALVGIFLLTAAVIRMKKIAFTNAMLVNIALMLGLTIVLHQLRIYHLPQGGSVTAGACVPLILVSLRYGFPVGMLAGFLYGFINLMQDPFILHPVQVLFDYPLPYMAFGLAAISRKNILLSTAVAFLARFLCHFISGVVFFSSYAPEGMSAVVYSLTVNATYIVPECIICCLILKALPVERLLAAMDRRNA